MIPVWLNGVLFHNDFAVPHVLSLTLVRDVVVLKVRPEMTHLGNPWYNVFPAFLPHNRDRDIRIYPYQPNQHQVWSVHRSDDEFVFWEPFKHPLHLFLGQIVEELYPFFGTFWMSKYVWNVSHPLGVMEGNMVVLGPSKKFLAIRTLLKMF